MHSVHKVEDSLWLSYDLGQPYTNGKIRVFLVDRLERRLTATYVQGDAAAPALWAVGLPSTLPCFVHKALGLLPYPYNGRSDGDLMCEWQKRTDSNVLNLVLRRQFECPAFGPDPFLRSESTTAARQQVTLVQRPVVRLGERAEEEAVLHSLDLRSEGMQLSAAWSLQASPKHYVLRQPPRGGAAILAQVGNDGWDKLFTRGWRGLMDTAEPQVRAGTLALFELHPGGAGDVNYSPFPLCPLVSRFGSKSGTQVDHLLVGTPPLRMYTDKEKVAAQPWTLEFPALRSHSEESVKCALKDFSTRPDERSDWSAYATDGGGPGTGHGPTYALQLNFSVAGVVSEISSPVRAGGLDLLMAAKPDAEAQSNAGSASFIFRVPRQVWMRNGRVVPLDWGGFVPLEIAWWGVGCALPDAPADGQAGGPPKRAPLRLPLAAVRPGETDHVADETELFSQEGGLMVAKDRPLLINLPTRPVQAMRVPKPLMVEDAPAAEAQAATAKSAPSKSAASKSAVTKSLPGKSAPAKPRTPPVGAPAPVAKAVPAVSGLTLEISQTKGLNFSETAVLRILRENPVSTDPEWINARLFYLDRAPFLACLVDTNTYADERLSVEDKAGSEIAYWTTEGPFRGWQRRAKSGEFRMVLPPQGVGEEMEKGTLADGYADLQEKERAKFRFTSSTLLTLDSSDLARRYHGLPWNLRMHLNSLQENDLVGLPVRMASFEMLYGLRFTLKDVPYLRLAEMLARQGYPRALMNSEPPEYDQSEYWEVLPGAKAAAKKATEDWNQLTKSWTAVLRLLESRLAVYEIFDQRQVEFDAKGEPVGLLVEAHRGDEFLRAELRKRADLRTSLPSEPAPPTPPSLPGQPLPLPAPSRPVGTPGPLLQTREEDRESPAVALVVGTGTAGAAGVGTADAQGADPAVADWWRRLVPHYEHGLAGSMAWAFESKLVYESLWADNDHMDSPAVVEAVEATVARLYFSALGGWGTQQASFAGGKIRIAVSVDMGRVSELRVEIIGRIGIFKNKAKLVTVFRRTVLPTRQFVAQQDRLAGRAVLRKVEEWVEFIQKHRLLQEGASTAPASLKACSCEDRILVDSRWGTDIYTAQGKGVAWKVPLRRPGTDPEVYGPASVLIHFHTHAQSPAGDVCGHIENLDNLWFWTAVSAEPAGKSDAQLTDDTDAWADMAGVDTFPMATIPEDEMTYGAPAVPEGAADYTFRIGGLSQEADLCHYQAQDPALSESEQPSVGSVTRTITVCSGALTGTVDDEASRLVANSRGVLGHAENALAFMEQLTSRQPGEVITGWEEAAKTDLAGIPAAVQPAVIDAIRPVLNCTDEVQRRQAALMRSLSAEVQHLGTQWSDWTGKATAIVSEVRKDALADAAKVTQTLQKKKDELLNLLNGTAVSLKNTLKTSAQAAMDAGRAFKNAVVTTGTNVAALPAAFEKVLLSLNLLQDDLGKQKEALARRLRELVVWDMRDATATVAGQVDAALLQIRNDVLVHAAVTAIAALDEKAADFRDKAQAILQKITPDSMDAALDALTKEITPLKEYTRQEDYLTQKLARLAKILTAALEKVDNLAEDITAKLVAATDLIRTRIDKATELEKALAAMPAELAKRVRDLVADLINREQAAVAGLETELTTQCQQHIDMLKSRLDGISTQLTQAVAEECAAVRQAGDVLVRNGQKLEGAVKAKLQEVGGKAEDWIATQRQKAETSWTALQGKLKSDPNSPISKLQGKVEAIKQAPLKFCEKAKACISNNVAHALQQGSGMIRGMASHVVGTLRRPLSTLLDLSTSSEADFQKALLVARAELDRGRQAIFDSASAVWGQATSQAQGTLDQAESFLLEAQILALKLKQQIDDIELKVNASVHYQVPVSQAQRVVDAILPQLDRLEHYCQLPWLRSLPGVIEIPEIKRVLVELEHIIDTLPSDVVLKGQLGADESKELNDWKDHASLAFADLIGKLKQACESCNALRNEMPEQTGLQGLQVKIKNATDKVIETIDNQATAGKEAVIKQIKDLIQKLDDLEANALTAVDEEAGAISKGLGEMIGTNCDGLGGLLEGSLTTLMNDIGERFSKLPPVEFFERGLGQAEAWLNAQREFFSSKMGRLGMLKNEVSKDVAAAAGGVTTLFRSFGKVPSVPGLDFHGMTTFAKDAGAQADAYLSNFASRFRSVGYTFQSKADEVKKDLAVAMSPVKAMVDRTRNALGEAAQEARMKAASLEMKVSQIKRQLESTVDDLKKDAKLALRDVLPDFGGIKLEKLLGAAGMSDAFKERLRQCSNLTHGVDKKTLSAWVDSKVDGLVLDQDLTLFSFGPMALSMKQVTLNSHIRIQTNAKGESEKLGEGQILANWEVTMGGQPLVTYEQAKLECKNGKVSMELDPKKVRMPSMLQMLADMMSRFSYKDDSGLVVGLRPNLPTEVTGFVTFNMDFPPMGGGTTSLQNLRLALLFELSLAFPRFPSLKDSHLRISAGAGLSDSEAPFILGVFILGGCGWFQMRLDYLVPFQGGSPTLGVVVNVAIGLSASLCINLGFASGQVYIALAVEISCHIAKGSSDTRFRMALAIAGVLEILGGLISVYLVISLSISYASGQPMVGRGRVCLTIRICWCVKIKVDKSFEYTFGKGFDRSAQSAGLRQSTPALVETAPDRVPVPAFTIPQPEPAPAMAAPADYHRKARRMVV